MPTLSFASCETKFFVWARGEGRYSGTLRCSRLVVRRLFVRIQEARTASGAGKEGSRTPYGALGFPEAVCRCAWVESGCTPVPRLFCCYKRWQWTRWQVGGMDLKLWLCGNPARHWIYMVRQHRPGGALAGHQSRNRRHLQRYQCQYSYLGYGVPQDRL